MKTHTIKTKWRLCFSVALCLLSIMLLACNLYKSRLDRSTMFAGTAMSDAATAFKKKIGGSFKALDVQINPDSVTLRAQDPKQPANVDEYRYSALLRSVSGPRPVELSSLENNLDNTLFDFDSVNWAATESLAHAAIERTKIDGGKVEKMTVERGLAIGSLVTKSGTLKWTIEVNNSREHATAYADPQGKITRLDLSHTARAAKFDLYSPETLREAVTQVDEAFGGHAMVWDIHLWDKGLQFQAPDPKTGEIDHYSYSLNGVSNDVLMDLSGPDLDLNRLKERHKLEDILFELDSIKLEQAPEFGRKAIQRLGFENARLGTMEIKREEVGESTKLITFWVVSCQAGRRWGTVSYDLNGKELGVNTW